MAKAIDFEYANYTLNPAPGDEETVHALRVFRDEQQHVSCWELSADEKLEIVRTGRIYLFVMGHSHPPVCVVGCNPFQPPPGLFIAAEFMEPPVADVAT